LSLVIATQGVENSRDAATIEIKSMTLNLFALAISN
jgi:hypothetical protein